MRLRPLKRASSPGDTVPAAMNWTQGCTAKPDSFGTPATVSAGNSPIRAILRIRCSPVTRVSRGHPKFWG